MRRQPGCGEHGTRPGAGAALSDALWCRIPRKQDPRGPFTANLPQNKPLPAVRGAAGAVDRGLRPAPESWGCPIEGVPCFPRHSPLWASGWRGKQAPGLRAAGEERGVRERNCKKTATGRKGKGKRGRGGQVRKGGMERKQKREETG